MNTIAKTEKTIFQYDDYRDFLKDLYQDLKARDRKYSFRYFSKLAGFKSSSVLKMIIDGKRNMGSGTVDQFASALKLSEEETAFFKILVQFNQAKPGEEKQSYAQAMLHFNDFKKHYPLSEAQFNFYARWYTPVIWELVGVRGFKNDAEWIARKIKSKITTAEIKQALSDLVKLGLLERTKTGKLKKTTMNVVITTQVGSSAMAQWHYDMIKRGADSIQSIPRDQRDITSVTCSMSLTTVEKIKEKVRKFRKELVEMTAQEPSPTMVYQLNFQLFPHTEIEDDGPQ
jgi:uncharacterized protein (TIGR02147 family)